MGNTAIGGGWIGFGMGWERAANVMVWYYGITVYGLLILLDGSQKGER
jgi:hypothetical protein